MFKTLSNSRIRHLGVLFAVAIALGLGVAATKSAAVEAHPGYLQIYLNDPHSLPKWGYCGTCHINPGGGGYGAPLTVFGEAFKEKNFTVDEELRNEFPDRFSKVPRGESGGDSLVAENANYAFWSMEGTGGHFSGVTTDSSGSPWFSTLSPAQLVKLDTLGNQFQVHPITPGCRELAADQRDAIWCLGLEKATDQSADISDYLGVFKPDSMEMERVAGVGGGEILGGLVHDPERNCVWVRAGLDGDLLQISTEDSVVHRSESPWENSGGEKKDTNLAETFLGVGVNGAGVWYTVANSLVHFDPSSEEFQRIELPDLDEDGGPLEAQGIAVDDQLVWLTFPKLGQIVSFDRADQAFVPYYLPHEPDQESVPSDLRIDSRGRIWIEDPKEGAIWKFEAETRSFLKFPVPNDEISKGSLSRKLFLDAWDGLWITSVNQYKVGLLNTADY